MCDHRASRYSGHASRACDKNALRERCGGRTSTPVTSRRGQRDTGGGPQGGPAPKTPLIVDDRLVE
eukprot:15439988-Alexandrium_andersonii.AAC.1